MRQENHPLPGHHSWAKLLNALAASGLIMAAVGCQNTTTSTLSPVQGTASLNPVQPSGFTSVGSPTRVPPPPTGSYNSNGYGSPSGLSAPAPVGAPPPVGTSSFGTSPVSYGVSQASPNATGGFSTGSSVQQTGWVGASTYNPAAGGVAPASASAPNQLTPAPVSTPITAGGMPVIDMTASPMPPGYVPAQPQPSPGVAPAPVPNASGVQMQQVTPIPGTQPINTQGSNPNFVQTSAVQPTGFESTSGVQTAAAPTTSAFPTTEPYTPTQPSSNESLEWRRPSPRY